MYVLFIIIIGNSLENREFSEYVASILANREQAIIRNKSMELQILKPLSDLFKNSKMVSSKL